MQDYTKGNLPRLLGLEEDYICLMAVLSPACAYLSCEVQ